MKAKNLLRKAFLLLALLGGVNSAWADDYTLGASKFNGAKTIATVNGVDFTFSKAHGGNGQTGYTEYIKFSKNSTYTITLPEGFNLTNINIKGYTNNNGKTDGEISSVGGNAQTGKTFPARDNASLASESAITTGYDFAISQTGGSVAITTANTNQIGVLITITGTAAASEAVDPEFSLSSPISISGEGQIKVGNKDNLDGIKLSSITYTVSGIVTVDEDGVVTPVAKGTTTINFNSSAVTDKYNASEGNSLTITVIEPVAVYDASATNAEFVLSQANIIASENEFVSAASENWADRTMPAPYPSTSYYNLSGTSRYITFKASGASTFQIAIQNGSGSNDRKYTVKIGDAEGEDILAIRNSLNTSKVFATGTTGEVTIKIIGTSDGSLYPAAIKFNPAISVTIPSSGIATLASALSLDFTGVEGLTAYTINSVENDKAQCISISKVPANTGIILQGTAGKTYSIPVYASGESPAEGLLEPCVKATPVEANVAYILKDGEFHLVTAESTVPAGKAYLPAKFVTGAKAISLSFGGITGISKAEAETKATAVGKFVKNGKLVIVKDGNEFNANGQKLN
jgi:hypothetical protein